MRFVRNQENVCGIKGNISKEKFKVELSKMVTPDMQIYKELHQSIFAQKKRSRSIMDVRIAAAWDRARMLAVYAIPTKDRDGPSRKAISICAFLMLLGQYYVPRRWRLSKGRDVANSAIRHQREHMRSHARALNPLARGYLMWPVANLLLRQCCAPLRSSRSRHVAWRLTATDGSHSNTTDTG